MIFHIIMDRNISFINLIFYETSSMKFYAYKKYILYLLYYQKSDYDYIISVI